MINTKRKVNKTNETVSFFCILLIAEHNIKLTYIFFPDRIKKVN